MNFVKEIKAHALANYNRDGWDFVVECYSDEEICELTARCTTAEQAIAKIGRTVKAQDDYRRDIQAEAF
jgi:hypothetical protein